MHSWLGSHYPRPRTHRYAVFMRSHHHHTTPKRPGQASTHTFGSAAAAQATSPNNPMALCPHDPCTLAPQSIASSAYLHTAPCFTLAPQANSLALTNLWFCLHTSIRHICLFCPWPFLQPCRPTSPAALQTYVPMALAPSPLSPLQAQHTLHTVPLRQTTWLSRACDPVSMCPYAVYVPFALPMALEPSFTGTPLPAGPAD